jgi:hypothetical protein
VPWLRVEGRGIRLAAREGKEELGGREIGSE